MPASLTILNARRGKALSTADCLLEDQPDNEMRCIEHLLQRQVDAIIVSTSLPPEHPLSTLG